MVIWWRHDIWISEKLQFDYEKKNEKSQQKEIKKVILVSQVVSFRLTKENSKNVTGTTFKGTAMQKCSGHNL